MAELKITWPKKRPAWVSVEIELPSCRVSPATMNEGKLNILPFEQGKRYFLMDTPPAAALATYLSGLEKRLKSQEEKDRSYPPENEWRPLWDAVEQQIINAVAQAPIQSATTGRETSGSRGDMGTDLPWKYQSD